jgi:hypothetical protein
VGDHPCSLLLLDQLLADQLLGAIDDPGAPQRRSPRQSLMVCCGTPRRAAIWRCETLRAASARASETSAELAQLDQLGAGLGQQARPAVAADLAPAAVGRLDRAGPAGLGSKLEVALVHLERIADAP